MLQGILDLHQCGYLLGTLLSSLVFYMIVYGIQRLLELCDTIEEIKTGSKRLETETSDLEMQSELNKDVVRRRESTRDIQMSVTGIEPTASIKIDLQDAYEVENVVYKYEIVTYHRNFDLTRNSE